MYIYTYTTCIYIYIDNMYIYKTAHSFSLRKTIRNCFAILFYSFPRQVYIFQYLNKHVYISVFNLTFFIKKEI